jgi:hypothetical protein
MAPERKPNHLSCLQVAVSTALMMISDLRSGRVSRPLRRASRRLRASQVSTTRSLPQL